MALNGGRSVAGQGTVPVAIIPYRRINGTVIMVLCLILAIYSTVVFGTVLPWLSYSVPGIQHSLALTLSTGLAIYCFMGCVLLDPGRVPESWAPNVEAGSAVQEVKKTSGKQRFCQKCRRGKPPRTHHCRVCNRCVLRMDHHCPWMNNCIGQGNYRGFILFLLYINVSALHCLWLLSRAMMVRYGWRSDAALLGHAVGGAAVTELKWTPAQSVMQACAMFMLAPLVLGLVLLLVWNLFLLLHNKTTIEYHEGVTARIRAARLGAAAAQHPYDLGPCSNLHAICGQSVASWLLPVGGHAAKGCGTVFASAWDNIEERYVSIMPPSRHAP